MKNFLKTISLLPFLFSILFYAQELQSKKSWDQGPTFEGGNESLIKEIKRAIAFVVDDNYFVDGKVTLLLEIDEKGKYKVKEVLPNHLKNKKAFIDDMNYVLKRFKKRWSPALLNNNPVKSYFTIKINFSTMGYDEE